MLQLPPAPQPPLLFWQIFLLAFVTGMAASQVMAAWAALALLLWVSGSRILNPAALFWLGLAFASGYGWALRHAPAAVVHEEFSGKVTLHGRLESVRGLPDGRLSMLLDQVTVDGRPLEPGRLSWIWDKPPPGVASQRPLPGQDVLLQAKIRPITGFRNEGVRDSSLYWARQGVYYSAWMQGEQEVNFRPPAPSGFADPMLLQARLWREELRHAYTAALGLEQNPPGPLSAGKALLPALIFGDRFYLDSAVSELFSRAGLAHSLALSGQHLALAGAAAALLLSLTGRIRPGVYLLAPRRELLLTLSCIFALLYLWLGNAPPSLIRAALMLGAALLLFWCKRAFTLMDTLFAALLCFCLVWPQAVFDLGAQLSLSAVAGIALALPLTRRLARWGGTSRMRKIIAFIGLSLLLSLAAQLATLPFQLEAFGVVSPLFILNALWLPLLGFWILPLAALGLLCLPWPSLAALLLDAAAFPAQLFIQLLQAADAQGWINAWHCLRPLPLSVVGYGAALLAFSLGKGGGRLLLPALLLLPAGAVEQLGYEWSMRLDQRVEVRLLDVGQGQSLLLEWPGGRLVLDAGGSASPRFDPGRDIVAHVLTANRPPRLTWIMASHDDLDHSGGLGALARGFAVKGLARSGLHLNAAAGLRVEEERLRKGIPLTLLRAGDVLNLGPGLNLEVLHPPEQSTFRGNNSSLVLRLSRNGQGLALFCGDAQQAALRQVLNSGRELRARLLIVPHHGSLTSLMPEFYRAVAPERAFIAYGAGNSFGFPRQEVLDALQKEGIVWHGTGHEGELRAAWNFPP